MTEDFKLMVRALSLRNEKIFEDLIAFGEIQTLIIQMKLGQHSRIIIHIGIDELTVLLLYCTSKITDFIQLTELSKGESTANYRLKVTLVLPHITIPLTASEPVEDGQIKGVQLWFSKLTVSNLNNA